ncbi:DUF881 domain-containing protein [Streptomyces sp. NPDC059506]|uniref:DUF881 domain-containing protein n=1 Tax=Streptomyces TaxID=1883 RepID=UPI0021753166|nr:DUF881 domain-containing protein [Streptomyces sp. SCUT-3]
MSRSVVPRLLTAGIFALAGLLFWISFDTSRGTDLRSDDSMLRLSDLIREKSRDNAHLEDGLADTRRSIDALAGAGATDPALDKAFRSVRQKSGGTPVSGPAVTVTLTDAPPDAGPRVSGVPDPRPDDLVIHQQDLQAVVNALWRGGAEGIQVMDQRLISTSAVRCVGNTLILQGRVYSPPYVVKAVGDRKKLVRALDRDPVIQNYLLYVEAYGLGWKVEESDRDTLPGWSGTVDLHYAQPVQ